MNSVVKVRHSRLAHGLLVSHGSNHKLSRFLQCQREWRTLRLLAMRFPIDTVPLAKFKSASSALRQKLKLTRRSKVGYPQAGIALFLPHRSVPFGRMVQLRPFQPHRSRLTYGVHPERFARIGKHRQQCR